MCPVSWVVCDAIKFVLLQVALATAHPTLSPVPRSGRPPRARRISDHGGVCDICVAYAVCGGRVNLVGGWFVA